jgi:high-affinity iron transporter
VIDALSEAQARLGEGGLSSWASFIASFVILLREGLEAVLVVAALAAFLRRSGQAQAMPYIHAGWLAGARARRAHVVRRDTPGGSERREPRDHEGVTGLVAAAMLLYVGYWLHDKSHAQAWQRYLMGRAQALGTGAAWGLALTAFPRGLSRGLRDGALLPGAVGRRLRRGAAIIAGFGAALVVLVAVTFAMLRLSVRLPLGLFFGASGILLAALAVVLRGQRRGGAAGSRRRSRDTRPPS